MEDTYISVEKKDDGMHIYFSKNKDDGYVVYTPPFKFLNGMETDDIKHFVEMIIVSYKESKKLK